MRHATSEFNCSSRLNGQPHQRAWWRAVVLCCALWLASPQVSSWGQQAERPRKTGPRNSAAAQQARPGRPATPAAARPQAAPAPAEETVTEEAVADEMAELEMDALDMAADDTAMDEGGSDEAAESEKPSSRPKVDEAFFEARIRPVLVTHCYKCHSAEVAKPQGGLRVDSRDLLRQGGESGQAVVPGNPQDSLLLQALRYETYQMPPSGPLPANVIADFELWIEQGAPDPRSAAAAAAPRKIDLEAARQLWVYQTPRTSPLPSVTPASWPTQDLDYFILASQNAAGVTPIKDADPATLLRRLSLDLVGLPPTPEQLQSFMSDPSADHYARIVDQLLASAEFGERWGRHWLDAARYADTMGKTRNVPFTNAYRYRDYVIQAYNQDMPVDQFYREQIAGDLLTSSSAAERERRLIATGFLALGSHDLNERNRRAYTMQVVAEQIDTTTRAMLGLTVGCARCHDHKFDPISTRDYYAMAGIFLSTETLNGFLNGVRPTDLAPRGDRLISLAPDKLDDPRPTRTQKFSEEDLPEEARQRIAAARQQFNQLQQRLQSLQQNRRGGNPQRQQRAAQLSQQLEQRQQQMQRQLRNVLEQYAEQAPSEPITGPVCLGVLDSSSIRDAAIHINGEPDELGDTVPRGFLSVIAIPGTGPLPKQSSGRLELAKWITHPQNPLTARVYVNRVWSHLFGRGIVTSLDNFGETGARPTHPELLDHLAAKFMAQGWSTKQLIREMVLSHTYRLASSGNDANQAVDPDNKNWWRMNRKRLEFEAIRDSVLAVSGQLNLDAPAGSIRQRVTRREMRRNGTPQLDGEAFPHRSVYLPVIRNKIPETMMVFDFPEPSETVGQREVTTVPTQALFFLNDPLVLQGAAALSQQFQRESVHDPQAIDRAYRSVLCRPATPEEIDQAQRFFADSETSVSVGLSRWAVFFQAMMASAEFRYAL